MTHNQIEYWKLEETKRSNRTNEAENKRHNVATEGESYRHNYATETETNRHNMTTELIDMNKFYEQARSNRANEALAHERNTIESGKLSELIRSNKANEYIKTTQLAENERHNRVTENLGWYGTTMSSGTSIINTRTKDLGSRKGIGTATATSTSTIAGQKALTTAARAGKKGINFPFIMTFKDILEMNKITPSKKGDIAL